MSVTSPARSRPRSFRRHVTLTTLALMLVALVFSLVLIRPLHAQGASSHPGGNIQDPKVLNVDIARPAVVRILFGVTGASVTVKACAAENTTFKIPSGLISGGVGSGAFISAQGDVLTASHVVKDEGGETEFGIVEYFSAEILANIQKVCNINLVDVNGLLNFFVNNPTDFTFDLGTSVGRVWLDTSYHGAYTETTLSNTKSYTFQVLGVKDFVTTKGYGDDVAVIHVNGLTDMPHIAIGDSTAVSPTDHLTEIGYPGNGDDNHIDLTTGGYKRVPTDWLTQSLNDLYVSAIKTNDVGDQLIQVGGNQEHGDSGGPTLNAAGQIVGVVSFGPDISQSGGLPAGTGFLQASNSAQSLVSGANIDTTPGTFQTRWRQALTDFAATSSGHWHKAVTELSALQQDYPAFKGGDDYLTYAQNQADNESPLALNLGSGSQTLVLAVGGLAVLVLLVIFVLLGVGRSRRRKQVAVREAVAVAPGGYGAGQSAAMPYPQGNYPPQNYPSAPYGSNAPPASYGPSNGPPQYGQGNQSAQYGQGNTPPPPPAQFSHFTYPPQGQAAPAPPHTTCGNGHPMQPNETYCRVCGATRV